MQTPIINRLNLNRNLVKHTLIENFEFLYNNNVFDELPSLCEIYLDHDDGTFWIQYDLNSADLHLMFIGDTTIIVIVIEKNIGISKCCKQCKHLIKDVDIIKKELNAIVEKYLN